MSYSTLKDKVEQFFSSGAIVVIGVSNDPNQPANHNFRTLKSKGFMVFPVNPYHEKVEGKKSFKHVNDIPKSVNAAIVFTHPEVTPYAVKECVEAGIKNIWVHKGIGHGSRSDEASKYMKDKPEINFIDGACPMMFVNNADFFHRGLKNVLRWTGGLPA